MASTSKLTATEKMPTVTRLRRALARPLPSTSRNSPSLDRLCNGGGPPPPPPPPFLAPPPLPPPPSEGTAAGIGCSIVIVGPGNSRTFLSPRNSGSASLISAAFLAGGGGDPPGCGDAAPAAH